MSKLIAFFFIILLLPFFLLLAILIKFSGEGQIIFSQRRIGYRMRVFTIYKFRTMKKNAEKQKVSYLKLNEADGPVFKIKNDPRYTKIGKIISHLGLDELPQLLNILKGEMTFVGPRPLPIEEANKIPNEYHLRFSVMPGITSLWVIAGGHSLSFRKWMELDLYYINHKSLWLDSLIIYKTILLFFDLVYRTVYKNFTIKLK